MGLKPNQSKLKESGKSNRPVNLKNNRLGFMFTDRAVINFKLQWRLVAFNALVILAFSVFSFALIGWRLDRLLEKGLKDPQALQVELMVFGMAICFFSVVASVTLNLFISHKFSAPINRLYRYFKDVADTQEVLPLAFRKDDYYHELPPVIIQAFQRVRDKAQGESESFKRKVS